MLNQCFSPACLLSASSRGEAYYEKEAGGSEKTQDVNSNEVTLVMVMVLIVLGFLTIVLNIKIMVIVMIKLMTMMMTAILNMDRDDEDNVHNKDRCEQETMMAKWG